jgi:hypothetical protein
MIQSTVAMSTTEAKYMAEAEAAKEAFSLTGLVKELGIQQGCKLFGKQPGVSCENQAH